MTYRWFGNASNNSFNYTGDYDLEAYGRDGHDFIWGNKANDVIYGENGDDTLRGYWGADYLDGGNGNDILDGELGNDNLTAGSGNDSLYGGTGNDYLHGGDGSDYLDGGDGTDYLYGGAGSDTILGGYGDDRFYASAGSSQRDILTGGDGFDQFRLMYVSDGVTSTPYAGDGFATITDYNNSYDTIELSKNISYFISDIHWAGSSSLLDRGIFNTANGDCIAVLLDTTNFQLSSAVYY
jgi:serralysin